MGESRRAGGWPRVTRCTNHRVVREADRVFTRVWQYEVVGGREAEFERVYAADGAWARLFARSEGFLGTELFRSLSGPGGYLTVDRFTSADAFQRFLEQHASSYAALDRQSQALTVSEQEIATGRHP
jgi:heme-degrading monooxygenase HmoA